jgi:hypothetical protein
MSESMHRTENLKPPMVNGLPQTVHDDNDLNVRAIVWLGGGLFTFVLAVLVVVGGVFRYFGEREDRRDRDALPMASEDAARPVEERVQSIPAPRLEGIEPQSVAQRRAADADRLIQYGWVDEKAQVVHVPVDVAMKVILEKKLLPTAPKDKGPAREKR